MDTLLSQKVYDQLYAALLDHRLKPGGRLTGSTAGRSPRIWA